MTENKITVTDVIKYKLYEKFTKNFLSQVIPIKIMIK